MFEHAADLAGLQLKAAEAERNLNDARNNADRIADLLTEVEPRLRTLERAARQAREWQGVHDRLKSIERAYFKSQLIELSDRLDRADSANQMESTRLGGAQTAVDTALEQLEDARELAIVAQAAYSRQSAHLRAITEQSQQLAHERDLAAERIAAIDRRREDLIDGQRNLEERAVELDQEIAIVQSAIDRLTESGEEAASAIPELERDVTEGSRESPCARAAAAATCKCIGRSGTAHGRMRTFIADWRRPARIASPGAAASGRPGE